MKFQSNGLFLYQGHQPFFTQSKGISYSSIRCSPRICFSAKLNLEVDSSYFNQENKESSLGVEIENISIRNAMFID